MDAMVGIWRSEDNFQVCPSTMSVLGIELRLLVMARGSCSGELTH